MASRPHVRSHVTGVILAAGEGRRMGALSGHLPKPCLPVANEPLIGHHLRMLAAVGVRDVIVVVGHLAEVAVETARRWTPPDTRVRFVTQAERRGIAHALHQARGLVNGSIVVLVLGDTFFVPSDLGLGLAPLEGPAARDIGAVLSVRRVADPALIRLECTVRFDECGRLLQIREKPLEPWNDLKPCGTYFFSRRIFEAIERTPASALRGEVEITDAIQTLVDLGCEVHGAPTMRWDANLTVPADLVDVNLRVLQDLGQTVLHGDGAWLAPSARLDRVVVGPGAKVGEQAHLSRSVLTSGAVVESGRRIDGCIVGDTWVVDAALGPDPLRGNA